MSELIGLPKTLLLVKSLGGTTFLMPKRVTRLGEERYTILADIIGADAASALCRHYGGLAVYIPRCAHALRCIRDKEIILAFEASQGQSANAVIAQLAHTYAISDRRIWKILKGSVDDGNIPRTALQATLF